MRKVEEESYWHFISFKNVENDSFAGPNTMRISEEPPVAAEGDETLASAVQQWFYESHSRCKFSYAGNTWMHRPLSDLAEYHFNQIE